MATQLIPQQSSTALRPESPNQNPDIRRTSSMMTDDAMSWYLKCGGFPGVLGPVIYDLMSNTTSRRFVRPNNVLQEIHRHLTCPGLVWSPSPGLQVSYLKHFS